MGNISFFVVCLFLWGVYGDLIEDEISVMEGDSITLHTDITDEQNGSVIDWRFGRKGDLIARVNRKLKTPALVYDDIDDGKFRDRLQINEKTGDLTITTIGPTHSGLYILSINAKNFKKTFNVTVVLDKTYGVKTIPVLQGESVTLHTGSKEGQTYQIQWIFEKGNIVITKTNKGSEVSTNHKLKTIVPMVKKMELDQETGSLKIRNIRNEQCGIYILQMTSKTHTIHKRFNITIFDNVKSLSVMKGDSVTLHTDADMFDEILWMFEHVDYFIATIHRKTLPEITYDERFKERLQLEKSTGSLTITNIAAEHSGLYYLEIISQRHTMHKSFIVNVCDAVRTINVKVGEPVTLDAGIAKIQQYDQLTLKFGNDTLIAQTSVANLMLPNTYGKYIDRILHHKNGSFTIKEIGIEDSGIYHLEISSTRHTLIKRFNVYVTVPHSGLSAGAIAGIGVCVAVVLLVAVGFGIYCQREKKGGTAEHDNGVI